MVEVKPTFTFSPYTTESSCVDFYKNSYRLRCVKTGKSCLHMLTCDSTWRAQSCSCL